MDNRSVSRRNDYYKNRIARQETSRNWKKANPEKSKADKINQRLKYYGLTQKSFNMLLEEQGNRCALCGDMFTDDSEVRRNKYIDHDHTTGFVRGIIHPKCNTLLGLADDSIIRLEQAITYLKTRSY